jgi:hypothetical protein
MSLSSSRSSSKKKGGKAQSRNISQKEKTESQFPPPIYDYLDFPTSQMEFLMEQVENNLLAF